MGTAKLTNTLVQSTLPGASRTDIRDTGLKGLLLRVEPGGAKRYYLDYRRPDGRRTSLKIGDATALTVAQARDAARALLARVALGHDPGAKPSVSPETLKQFVERHYAPWVREHRRTGAATVAMLLGMRELLGLPISALTRLRVSEWRTRARVSGNRASSLNRKVTALVAALNWGVRNGILDDHPCRGLERLPELDSAAKVRYLTPEEDARLFAALDAREVRLRQGRSSANDWRIRRHQPPLPVKGRFADHLKPMVVLSLNTGIRRGSLFLLEWRDVDFENQVLTIRAETAKAGKTYHVPLNAHAHQSIVWWREQSLGDGLVFPSPKNPGKPMDNCNSSWEQVLREARIENFRWHDMRHTFASRLVMAGADLNVVRELMGHADLKMTIRYAHLAPQAKRAAVDLL